RPRRSEPRVPPRRYKPSRRRPGPHLGRRRECARAAGRSRPRSREAATPRSVASADRIRANRSSAEDTAAGPPAASATRLRAAGTIAGGGSFMLLKHALLAAGLALAGVAAAQTQTADYPTRPVRVVVPFSPGGAVDGPMRLLAEGLTRRIGQAVFVENKPGA